MPSRLSKSNTALKFDNGQNFWIWELNKQELCHSFKPSVDTLKDRQFEKVKIYPSDFFLIIIPFLC